MGSEVRFTFWGGEGATEDMAGRLQQREGSMPSSQRQLQVGSGGRGCVDQSWGAGHSWSPSSVTSASGLAKGWPRLRVPNIPDCWHPHWAVGKSPCLDFRSPVCPPPTRTPAAPPQPGTAGGVSQAKTDSSVGTRLCIQKFPELSQGCEPEKWALGLLWPRTGHVGKDIPPWCPAVDGHDGSLGSSSHRPGRRGCPTRRGAPRPGLGPEVSAGP